MDSFAIVVMGCLVSVVRRNSVIVLEGISIVVLRGISIVVLRGISVIVLRGISIIVLRENSISVVQLLVTVVRWSEAVVNWFPTMGDGSFVTLTWLCVVTKIVLVGLMIDGGTVEHHIRGVLVSIVARVATELLKKEIVFIHDVAMFGEDRKTGGEEECE